MEYQDSCRKSKPSLEHSLLKKTITLHMMSSLDPSYILMGISGRNIELRLWLGEGCCPHVRLTVNWMLEFAWARKGMALI